MRSPGARKARVRYSRGWTVHTIYNPWGFTSPGEAPSWGLFPTGGVWMAQHLWEHYAFSGDVAFLKRVYPVMAGAARFCLDWLVEIQRPASSSLVQPTHRRIGSSRQTARRSRSAWGRRWIEIIWDLFTNVLEAVAGPQDRLCVRA